ncbi:hypothetical protein Tco_0151283 [Tanacetum coccineum]
MPTKIELTLEQSQQGVSNDVLAQSPSYAKSGPSYKPISHLARCHSFFVHSNIQEKTQLSRSRCMHSLKEIKSLFKFLSETLQDYGTMPIFKRTFSQDLDLLEQHLTKDILSRTDCTTTLTDLRTTFENAFNSELKARMQNYTRYDAQSFYDAMIFNMIPRNTA